MLQGKTALVTGCNRGIGKAIIEKFAKDGANLITVTRTQSTEFDDFLKLLLLFKSDINLLTRFGKTNPINFDKI